MQKSWFFLSTLAEDIISPVFFNHHQIITIHDGLFFAAVNRSLHGEGNNKGFIHIFLDFICEAFAQYLFIDAQMKQLITQKILKIEVLKQLLLVLVVQPIYLEFLQQ